jgi:hypothetical protein
MVDIEDPGGLAGRKWIGGGTFPDLKDDHPCPRPGRSTAQTQLRRGGRRPTANDHADRRALRQQVARKHYLSTTLEEWICAWKIYAKVLNGRREDTLKKIQATLQPRVRILDVTAHPTGR